MPRSKTAAFKGQAGLDRAKHFFNLLDNPQNSFKAIHIAGTSGKGSVGYILTSLLMAHEFKVGTHTSPHFYDIRERFLLNGRHIPSKDFIRYVKELIVSIQKMSASKFGGPSFFETTNAIAFTMCQDQRVDYGVIETGLGGLYDSTNTITRSDKLAIITKLGFDHVHILGDTLEKIAFQKAGIIAESGVVLALQPEDKQARNTIAQVANQRDATLAFIRPQDIASNSVVRLTGTTFSYHSKTLGLQDINLRLMGNHQIENTVIALQALEFLAERDNFVLQPVAIKEALSNLGAPGRFERRVWDGQEYILDGAHNPQKIKALMQTLQEYTPHKVVALIAFKSDKDVTSILQEMIPHVDQFIVSKYSMGPDDALHAPAAPEAIARIAKKLGAKSVVTADSVGEALNIAQRITKSGQLIIGTGSIYFVGELGHILYQLGSSIDDELGSK